MNDLVDIKPKTTWSVLGTGCHCLLRLARATDGQLSKGCLTKNSQHGMQHVIMFLLYNSLYMPWPSGNSRGGGDAPPPPPPPFDENLTFFNVKRTPLISQFHNSAYLPPPPPNPQPPSLSFFFGGTKLYPPLHATK